MPEKLNNFFPTGYNESYSPEASAHGDHTITGSLKVFSNDNSSRSSNNKNSQNENKIFRLTSDMGVVLYECASKLSHGCYFTEFELLS